MSSQPQWVPKISISFTRYFEQIVFFSTGLDPALPFFSTPQLSWKLDSTDAHYVDIIHTDAGYLGKAEALGHADFYVNGGSKQPICKGEECKNQLNPYY